MNKIRFHMITAISAVMTIASSCSGVEGSDCEDRTRFRISPSPADDRMRFGIRETKDEKELAYEKVAEEWNRNLILGSRSCEGRE